MNKLYLYIATMLFFLSGIFGALYLGYTHEGVVANALQPALSFDTIWVDMQGLIIKQFHHPLALLLSQIIVIMIATRFFGLVATKVLMPVVVGEIIAGIILGPSFFGAYLPELSATLFPSTSLGNLGLISQIGLIFFMFVIGMELDWNSLKNQTKASIVISNIGIVFPFFLGVLLSLYLYDLYKPEHTTFVPFALFIGISMSITAFPVLARIVKERNLTKTRHGAMALTCAAADDATAWYILAVIIAISSSTSLVASILSFGLIVAYMGFMFFAIRPFLAWLGREYTKKQTLGMGTVSVVFTILMLSALATEAIGIHALFGAFIAGAMMPPAQNSKLRELLAPKLEYVSVLVLLPLFFALTGLRTQIGLMENGAQWMIAGLIIAIAVVGKLFGAMFASKMMGFSWRESFGIGALMNTRGLMELIVLNIGYELGIINAGLFAIFVIMALVTTAMTGPLLSLAEKK